MDPIDPLDLDKEFDPTEYPAEYIAVERTELIQRILEKVEEAWARTPNAVLVIPRGTQAFHTTHDFLALGKLQGARDVRVSIASLDPTISGLARVLGFYLVDPPEGHPALAGDPSLDSAPYDDDVEKPTAPLSIGSAPEVPGWVVSPAAPHYTSPSLTTSTWLNNPGDHGVFESAQQAWSAGFSGASAPSQPPVRPGVPPPRTRPRQTGQLSPALITDSSIPLVQEEIATPLSSPQTASGRIKARRAVPEAHAYRNARGLKYGIGFSRSRSWGRILAVVALLVVLSLVGGSAYALVYLPEGTVSVTPRNMAITAQPVEITVVTGPTSGQSGGVGLASAAGQTGGGNKLSAPTLTSTLVHAPVTEEGTRAATASRQVARGKAQGSMRFTNRTGNAVFVAAGVQFKAANGVTIQTTQAGTVPPTVFGQSFGTLDLPVTANVAGPDGNLPAGQVAGVYLGQLNYVNSALQGGSMETIKVVSQQDIDGLVSDLRSRAEGRKGDIILGLMTSGRQLITQTISLADVTFDADHKAGEDGDAVHIKLSGQARAYVYDESALHDSVMQAIFDWVQNNLPADAGPNLDRNSVQYTPPVVQSVEPGRVLYTTSADGRVTFSLTPDLAAQIRGTVKGQDTQKARDLIIKGYGKYVNPLSIRAKVLWFDLDKLPGDPNHINVELGGVSGSTVPSPAQSQSSPDPRSQP